MAHLEQTVRDLTGQIQELQYHQRQLEQELQSLQGAAPVRGQTVRGAPQPPYAPPAPAAQYAPPQYAQPQQYPPPQPYSQQPEQFLPAPRANPAPAAAIGQVGSGNDAFNPTVDPGAPGAPRPLGESTTQNEPPPIYHAPSAADGGAGYAGSNQPGAPLNLSNLSPQADDASPSALNGTGATAPAGPPPGNPNGTAATAALPPPPPINPSATGAAPPPPPPPSASPVDEYKVAYNYFQRRDYAHAAQSFGTFLHEHPHDHLTPQAQYFLGESLFRARQYHDAAEAFLTVSTKYSSTARAPDALFGLGESLAAMGHKQDACASFGEVLHKYPRASRSLKESVAREQKRAHC